MFSCGSLASRFGKEYYIKSDGCMDYGFTRCEGMTGALNHKHWCRKAYGFCECVTKTLEHDPKP